MTMRADAVFEGGGIKVFGILGALSEAERRGYTWVNVAGTSAGAIIASLVAAGYSAAEICSLIDDLDFSMLKDKYWLHRVPCIGPALSLWFKNGLYAGKYLENWVKKKLAAKGIRTFKDLVIKEYENDPKFRYKLVIIATDVTRRKLLKLPHDIKDYAINPDNLEVSKAVRMSSGLPFFYKPCKLPYTIPGKQTISSFIIDGGVLSNFPVWIFDSDETPPWPTFGFKIIESEGPLFPRVNNPFDLLKAIVSTMLEAHDQIHELDPKSRVRTISIPSMGVKTTDFEMSLQLKEKLYRAGVQAAVNFYEGWDFETIRALYFTTD
ncbi:patatin-like phospholipase family protein [Pelotomaculum terephthalicicum JT]|uniref:patatin-like phospholipase family protein n=1 Tax=Pelotomaculum TaxID=191373 RepID=UPI0009D3A4AE|nr:MULTISPECIES: patatin-like phospholipase family protein [Pelotomaculum]MCG9966479.1 patatin-like phospholipase family protein [Pelotomaculum terephthalicicum JT]OPX85976.1 MAG: Patatin-like phospholipase [Pelotomaculum sp. PtaB.Bin117]OPY63380.1 MAG: Patatin-like phospholipase [Pelotomaculum sp. PtaU1.Bin065]